MSTSNDYLTLYLESLKDIANSLRIELILSDEVITLQNLVSIWKGLNNHLIYLEDSENIEEYTDDNEVSHYIYHHLYKLSDFSQSNIIKFNTILYLNSNDYIIGCTKLDKTISNKLDNYSYVNNINFDIAIELSDPNYNSLKVNYTITDNKTSFEYNYPLALTVIEKLNNLDNYIRYTNDVRDSIFDNTMSILTDNGIINNNSFYRFSLFSKIKATISNNLCDIFEFSYYEGKPIMFMYCSEINTYRLVDLLNVNMFGKSKNIIDSEILCILNFKDNYPNYYFAQNYLVLDSKSIINLITNELITYKEDIYIDSLDIQNNNSGPKPLTLVNHSNEIYKPTSEYNFYRKIGDWSVYLGNSLKTPQYWVSSFGSFLCTVAENTKLLTSRLFLTLENDYLSTDSEYKYTTIYCVFPQDTLKSNSYNERSYSTLSTITGCPRKVYNGPSSSSKYYNSYIFTYLNQGGLENNQLFDGIRHNSLSSYDIPQIIGTLSGIIFYIDNDNNIYYL